MFSRLAIFTPIITFLVSISDIRSLPLDGVLSCRLIESKRVLLVESYVRERTGVPYDVTPAYTKRLDDDSELRWFSWRGRSYGAMMKKESASMLSWFTFIYLRHLTDSVWS